MNIETNTDRGEHRHELRDQHRHGVWKPKRTLRPTQTEENTKMNRD